MSNSIKKDIQSLLKFVYSENNSLSVIFHENDLLMGVVGEFNKNLNEFGTDKDLSELKINDKSLSDTLTDLISKIGENIQIVYYKKYFSKSWCDTFTC